MIFTRVVLLPELPPDTGETNPLLKTIKVTNIYKHLKPRLYNSIFD